MIDVIFASMATRTEIMGLRKEIAILAGTLEAHFLCNPTRPDDDKTKTEMIILQKFIMEL